ncbi:MAG: FtsW/RodA/SpoVE family cell cycle protein [Patescibacteria group bacterium]
MDWLLNGSVFLLAIASLLTLASVAPNLAWNQALWFVLGFFIIFIFSIINWHTLTNYRWLFFSIYGVAVTLLIITYFFAPTIRGIKGWLVIGPLQLQTAEVAKLALIILFSYFFTHRHVGMGQWQNIVVSFVYLLIPAILILMQPDMGSVMVLFGIWLCFLFISGIRQRHLIIGLLLIAIMATVGWHSFLQDYQKERVIGLFNPTYDPLGINYGVIQSKIAIGSAGFLGKGFHQGTQTRLDFLPEAATDFIFAAFVEEWGLLGMMITLSALIFLIIRIIKIGAAANNNFTRFLCLGTAALFLIHLALNLGSNLGLSPVVGIPLTFFSYGGSNLIVSAALIGIVQSAEVSRG